MITDNDIEDKLNIIKTFNLKGNFTYDYIQKRYKDLSDELELNNNILYWNTVFCMGRNLSEWQRKRDNVTIRFLKDFKLFRIEYRFFKKLTGIEFENINAQRYIFMKKERLIEFCNKENYQNILDFLERKETFNAKDYDYVDREDSPLDSASFEIPIQKDECILRRIKINSLLEK